MEEREGGGKRRERMDGWREKREGGGETGEGRRGRGEERGKGENLQDM